MAISTRVCLKHPTVQATSMCKQCAKPLCPQCILRKPDGHFCSEACHDQYGQFKDRRVDSGGPGILSRLITWTVYAAVVLGIIWALARYANIGLAQEVLRKIGIPYR